LSWRKKKALRCQPKVDRSMAVSVCETSASSVTRDGMTCIHIEATPNPGPPLPAAWLDVLPSSLTADWLADFLTPPFRHSRLSLTYPFSGFWPWGEASRLFGEQAIGRQRAVWATGP
jgi:hypothetical protein